MAAVSQRGLRSRVEGLGLRIQGLGLPGLGLRGVLILLLQRVDGAQVHAHIRQSEVQVDSNNEPSTKP